MTHVKALQAGHSSQGTSEPITPALNYAENILLISNYFNSKGQVVNTLNYFELDEILSA